jgi:NAD(P)-dependent dehydrogenase (short-subunit alcohol dehydrogenase family)
MPSKSAIRLGKKNSRHAGKRDTKQRKPGGADHGDSRQLAVSRGLAGLTRGTKVTVNSVLPGPTRSEGIIDFLKSLASDPTAPPERIEAEFFAKGRPSSLLQRMIEPQEIANLVAYVASPLSSATNGAALRVDGGVTPTIG